MTAQEQKYLAHRLDVSMDLSPQDDKVGVRYSIPRFQTTTVPVEGRNIPEAVIGATQHLVRLLFERVPDPAPLHLPHIDVVPVKELDLITVMAQQSGGMGYPRLVFRWRHVINFDPPQTIKRGQEQLMVHELSHRELSFVRILCRWARKIAWHDWARSSSPLRQ